MAKVSLLIVDDHTIVREGLRALLRAHPGMEVVGEAENGLQAIRLAQQVRPDVVLMDVMMPHLNGYEAARQIRKLTPTPRVLVLTSYGDDDCIARMLEAGVSGFLTKQTVAQELVAAIGEVQKGNSFFSAPIARRLREQ